jgi:hypothetical protein
MTKYFAVGLFAVLMCSCEGRKLEEEATQKSKAFFKALKAPDENKMIDQYSAFKKFDTYFKSDSAATTSAHYEDDRVRVQIRNRFTNGIGKLSERDIILFFKKDSAGVLKIFDSKGLSDFSEKNEYKFGRKCGCITASDSTDQQMLKGMARSHELMMEKAIDLYLQLKRDIRVTDWSWETLYSGSVSGKGIVLNKSGFDVPHLKYSITFRDRAGNVTTKDDGYITYDKINAGDSKSFSFYTDYVGNANRASIDLVFDDDLIFNYLAEKEWAGNECMAFLTSQPDTKQKSEQAK